MCEGRVARDAPEGETSFGSAANSMLHWKGPFVAAEDAISGRRAPRELAGQSHAGPRVPRRGKCPRDNSESRLNADCGRSLAGSRSETGRVDYHISIFFGARRCIECHDYFGSAGGLCRVPRWVRATNGHGAVCRARPLRLVHQRNRFRLQANCPREAKMRPRNLFTCRGLSRLPHKRTTHFVVPTQKREQTRNEHAGRIANPGRLLLGSAVCAGRVAAWSL